MATRIPKDLEKNGGWEFFGQFSPAELKAGQIWRKCGPVDAIKVRAVMMPGYPEYDGGLPGVSVYFSVFPERAKSVRWAKDSSFIPGGHEQIMAYMKERGYALAI